MAKKMLIDATHAEETRVVVVDGTKVEEFDFETVNKRQLSGNIYLAKVTRVEPSLQAAFVDYGGNRHGFLAFAEIHPDYYQIPAADRQALIDEERAYAEAQEAEEAARARRKAPVAETAENGDETVADDDENGDDAIESVAEDDVTEEISAPKKPRARRYKIQEVVKVRQIMLVQVVKEERGNKGAALTTYLSLPGRYCVLMPNTARGGGISRKITNVADRKKLKEIATELEVPRGAGLIIRTAGSQRTKTEIRRDYEYLLRLWEQIRDLTFKSVAPAPIYEEGDLIKRNIRDLFSKDIDEVLVEGERGFRVARDFMAMIMPGHTGCVKHYRDPMPLFARYQVESYLGGMFNPVVQLKSGGYIVIGVTEALVAVDVNSGRATKEGSIEETALKTNLEAADEVARQLRLRDLAGLIVIDFIDMDERKNNAAVEKRMKERLKSDRARIQVGRISGFGLMEMSRQRLRPGMLESTTQPCAHCHGTGLIRSDDSLALTILRAIEEEGTRKRSAEVLVKAPIAVVNFLINNKREHIAGMETRYGMAIRIEADPTLISPDFAVEKFKTATRIVADAAPVLGVDASLMAAIDDDDLTLADAGADVADASDDAAETPVATGDDDDTPSRSRRRRRRRRRNGDDADTDTPETSADASGEASDDVADEQPRRSRSRSRSRSRKRDDSALPEVVDLRDDVAGDDGRAEGLPGLNAAPLPREDVADAAPVEVAHPVVISEFDAAPAPEAVAEAAPEPVAEPEAVAEDMPAPEPAADPAQDAEPEVAPEPAQVAEAAAEPAAEAEAEPEVTPEPEPQPEPANEPDAAPRPKRSGWWSR
ncbi:ribonuclease E/G [Paracoccus sp. (in: a-proteobacteria)]|uniref:Rne/Rng family ribonuclease n=1 Tax=Paracoccus sp. TaxID=267 RepID=UPI0026DF9240|nr:ribonuclease E/G [Paracoccus sp. (in: a-proteobacteria)]MDO5648217.1 ribonuclease E/G [Paracoccus sp. (in: a-proteobacteria)]